MSEHEHEWVFAYAALAADGTFTAHYECRACLTTHQVYRLSRAEVADLRGATPLLAIFWTPRKHKRLTFWQGQAWGAADRAPADPLLPALAYFDAWAAQVCHAPAS